MNTFRKKQFSKAWFIGLVLGLASSAVVVVYATVVSVPNTFTSGQTISAAQMNANFQAIAGCPSDMVPVGSICVDKYEASVVDAIGNPLTNTACSVTGADCTNIIAQSVTGVAPAVSFTWFQAQQACHNAGKRLLTNAEWQAAAAGTPPAADDSTGATCVTGQAAVQNTGSRGGCVSNYGAFDMAGNLWEWVADWMPASTPFDDNNLSATYGDDIQFNTGDVVGSDGFPAALLRGGDFNDAANAGVYAFAANIAPSGSAAGFGFRCGR